MKIALIAAAASVLAAPAAMAGPYVNIETNAGYTGNDYDAAVTEFHVGYEGEMGEDAGYYVQVGPAIVATSGEETTNEFSGKAGIGVDIAENVNVYGEVSFLTLDGTDDNAYGVKAGVKYTF